MNNCNGHGKCIPEYGQCLCDVGFSGADCSAPLIDLTYNLQEEFTSTGLKWWYFVHRTPLSQQNFEMTFDSYYPFDLYINYDYLVVPSQFEYDAAYTNQKYVRLRTSNNEQLKDSGVHIAVHIHGADFPANKYLENTL